MKWIAEFDLEDGDTMPEHMDLEYQGAKLDFHCKPLEQEPCEDAISRQATVEFLEKHAETYEDVRVKMGFKASAIVAAIEALEQATDIKCEAKEKTCETCGYKGERYISCACLTCCNYRRVHLEWKPKESEDKRINSLNNAIKHYEKLIKENEFLIKTNDSYNFSQLEWKKNVEEYSQLVKWLKKLQKIEHILDDWTKTEELEWKIREVIEE